MEGNRDGDHEVSTHPSAEDPRVNRMRDTSRDLARTMLQVLFLGALIAGTFWILQPFLLASIWAATIVVATWPVMLFVQARLWGKRGLAVTVMTLGLLLVLLVPLTLAIITIAHNADRIVGWAKSLMTFRIPPPPVWISGLPVVGSWLADQWAQMTAIGLEGVSERLAPYASTVAAWSAARVGGVGMMLLQFFLTVVIATILYAHGETAAAGVRRFARRLDETRGEGVVELSAQAVRAVALAVVVTAIVQSVLGGIGLVIVGVPFAPILTAIMLLGAVAQVGVGPVLVPAVGWLYWRGDSVWATVLLVWTVVVLSLDNFLRPLLIRKSADLPLLLIFTGVIGGLIGFGIIGLFIGPPVLAVAYTLTMAWLKDAEDPGAPPPSPEGPPPPVV
jgi:predicted PurR-regulated permease PerM